MGCKKSLMGAALSLAALPMFAEDATGTTGGVTANSVNIPAGINLTELISSGVAVLGGVVAVALAAWAGWLVIKKALKWIRASLS